MRIYLDHNATTPLRSEVVQAMTDVLQAHPGNPSSTHAEGADARMLLERAREQVARCLGARPREILFTGGATEANNTVLRGLLAEGDRAPHVVTSAVEHPSVVAPCEWLESRGGKVTRLPVDERGVIDPAALESALASGPDLCSVILANNETGVIQPVDAISQACTAAGVPLHLDATQAIGKWPVDVRALGVAYLSCSAHKFNGPKGAGCLFVEQARPLRPLLLGGPQERRLRGGTENMAGLVGLGMACELARSELEPRMARYAALRDRLWTGLRKSIPGVRWNGEGAEVLPNTLNVEFEETAGDVVLQALDLAGVAVSAGAACHSGSITPSHVLTAMGRTAEQARGALRFSVGHGVDEDQIDRAVRALTDVVERTRKVGAS